MSELLLFTPKEREALEGLYTIHQRIHALSGLVHIFSLRSERGLYGEFTPGRRLDTLLREPHKLKQEVIEVGVLAAGLEEFVDRPIFRIAPRNFHGVGRTALSLTEANAGIYGDVYVSLNTYADAVVEANRQVQEIGCPPEALDVWHEAVDVCRTVAPQCWLAPDDLAGRTLPRDYFATAGAYLDEATRQAKLFSL